MQHVLRAKLRERDVVTGVADFVGVTGEQQQNYMQKRVLYQGVAIVIVIVILALAGGGN